MKTRISVRSPRNDSVILASQESVGERRSQHDRSDAAEGSRAHVDGSPEVIAIAEQRDALVAQRAQREAAAAAALNPPFEAVTRQRPRDAAQRDIEDCQIPTSTVRDGKGR